MKQQTSYSRYPIYSCSSLLCLCLLLLFKLVQRHIHFHKWDHFNGTAYRIVNFALLSNDALCGKSCWTMAYSTPEAPAVGILPFPKANAKYYTRNILFIFLYPLSIVSSMILILNEFNCNIPKMFCAINANIQPQHIYMEQTYQLLA